MRKVPSASVPKAGGMGTTLQTPDSNRDAIAVAGSTPQRRRTVPPPPPQPLRRVPLRRMPTELVLTTRMPAVKQPSPPRAKRASGVVRPVHPMPEPRSQELRRPVLENEARAPTPQPSRARPISSPVGAPAPFGVPSHVSRPSGDALHQTREQLALALKQAHKHERRALDAELRALRAEHFTTQPQHPALDNGSCQHKERMRLIKHVLQACVVGVAIGGYLSLLLPIRERAIAQAALIRQLTQEQQQLRLEREQLRARLERLERLQQLGAARDEP